MVLQSITRANVVGWALTIIISITGAYSAINARLYEVEKKIELLQLQIDNDSKKIEQQENDMKEIRDMFFRIDKNLTEVRGIVNQKQDKFERSQSLQQ